MHAGVGLGLVVAASGCDWTLQPLGAVLVLKPWPFSFVAVLSRRTLDRYGLQQHNIEEQDVLDKGQVQLVAVLEQFSIDLFLIIAYLLHCRLHHLLLQASSRPPSSQYPWPASSCPHRHRCRPAF